MLLAGPALGFNNMARQVRGLIDTGAESTCIGIHLARERGLQPHGKRLVQGVSGEANRPLHIVNIGFLSETGAPYFLPEPLEVLGMNAGASFDVLIGMDILMLCELVLHRGGAFALKLP